MSKWGLPPPGYRPGIGRGATPIVSGVSRDLPDPSDRESRDYEAFLGGGSFGGLVDKDDEQADLVYDTIEKQLEQRKNKKRKVEETAQKPLTDAGGLLRDFGEFKRGLASMDNDSWSQLPDAQEYLKVKKRAYNRDTAAPDEILMASITDLGSARSKALVASLDLITPETTDPIQKPVGEGLEIRETEKARKLFVSITSTDPENPSGWIGFAKLEESDNNIDEAVKIIDQGSINCPESLEIHLESIRLHRKAFDSLSLKRAVHYKDKYIQSLTKSLNESVKQIPDSEILWLSVIDAEVSDTSKRIRAAQGLKHLPKSLQLWNRVIDLEFDLTTKRKLLAKAVITIDQDQSEDLWIKLAEISETNLKASVINEGRKRVGKSYKIWIAACQLQESQIQKHHIDSTSLRFQDKRTSALYGVARTFKVEALFSPNPQSTIFEWSNELKSVTQLLDKADESLKLNGVNLSQSEWLSIAESSASAGFILTPAAITLRVSRSLTKHEILSAVDSVTSILLKFVLLMSTIEMYPGKKSPWIKLLSCTTLSCTPNKLQTLRAATLFCPLKLILWLMLAKVVYKSGDFSHALSILDEACLYHSNEIEIAIAKAKTALALKDLEMARRVLAEMRMHANEHADDMKRLFLKSAVVEFSCGEFDSALALCSEGLQSWTFGDISWKYLVLRIQLLLHKSRSMNDHTNLILANQFVDETLKIGEKFPACWILCAEAVLALKGVSAARSVLEKARMVLPGSEAVWLASINLELLDNKTPSSFLEYACDHVLVRGAHVVEESDNTRQARLVVAKALVAVPSSPVIWRFAIKLEPRISRHAKCLDALKKCPNSGIVASEVGLCFALKGEKQKARKWLQSGTEMKATDFEPEGNLNGDVWIALLKFELSEASLEERAYWKDVLSCAVQGSDQMHVTGDEHMHGEFGRVLDSASNAEPNRGFRWNSISKDPSLWSLSFKQKLLYAALQS